MHEVLSRIDDPKAPLQDQDFYELELYDSSSAGEPVFCIREARASWDRSAGRMVWSDQKTEAFATLLEARKRYAGRLFALAERGFKYSDMEMF